MASSSSSSSSPPPLNPKTQPFSIQSLTSNLLSHLPFPNSNPPSPPSDSMIVPFALPFSSYSVSNKVESPPFPSSSSLAAAPSMRSRSLSSGVRIEGGGGGGPAFVGQVFSMLDPSGNGLMTVTSHFDIPFLSKRTPDWMKKMFSIVTKKEENSPVFRFFMDLSDAVAHVKRLNIPTGMVGACRLDVAYQHFKEEPHMFQFVPNEKQVMAANRLLNEIPMKGRRRKIDGVPVFTAENLNIAIATNDGIKWYTPYFFDKKLLDSILETSVDQHFSTLIQARHTQRRGDVMDDSLTSAVEESGDSLFEPQEVQEVLDELGHSGIPLSVISKAAEIQLLDVVDKVLLGNKWMRKASGIQPRFPYVVDTFEERTALSVSKPSTSTSSSSNSEDTNTGEPEFNLNESARGRRDHFEDHSSFRLPFGNWLSNPWSWLHKNASTRFPLFLPVLFEVAGRFFLTPQNIIFLSVIIDSISGSNSNDTKKQPISPLLPRITMVGVSMGEGGQMSKASLKRRMENLTNELEETRPKSTKSSEDIEPLFVANVGDYPTITKMNSA